MKAKPDKDRPNLNDEIYKDFAIVHANAERALNLMKGVERKIDKVIEDNPPDPWDGDEFYQIYEFRKDCVDAINALIDVFDYPLAQDILKRADKAIAAEAAEEEELTPNQIRILQTIQEIAEELGSPAKVSKENCLNTLLEVKSRSINRRIAILRRKESLDQAHSKMQLIVLPLLRMALEAEYRTEEGDENEDKNTLIEAATEILEQALRLMRGVEE